MTDESTTTPRTDSDPGKEEEKTAVPGQSARPSAEKEIRKDEAAGPEEPVTTAEGTAPAADTGAEDDGPDVPADAAPARTASGTGFGAGAAAVVSAAFGLCSLTGTSVGQMLHARKELIGQIEASSGGGGDQIEAYYSVPWHTAALLNGIFALLAILVGGLLLALHAQRAGTRSWVKSVALAGLVLGAVGLLVSLGMYFDLFANAPELPGAGS
ncbi:hypothetical protein DMH02_028865 [Streptomyces sp. WAC 00631]|uniref:hypothetical protein n=1 Tax=unclassified Streptomyces TaxID=2593676 RepID=UPI00163C5504|nr:MULTISPECIES: hypothetical protein [unclassified Streptomyces]MCC5037077.1 hypothetical protein [Streptomyces sp. WAC 00631]MCC9737684.1 hypothetical protein [Streptomyces sp. MNU89]